MPNPPLDNFGCHRCGHTHAERPRWVQIELKFGGPLDWQLGRLGALDRWRARAGMVLAHRAITATTMEVGRRRCDTCPLRCASYLTYTEAARK
jgi:hypothetical protein